MKDNLCLFRLSQNNVQAVETYTFFFFFAFCFLGPHQWHMEVPRIGVKSELQQLAYTTAIETLESNLHTHGY